MSERHVFDFIHWRMRIAILAMNAICSKYKEEEILQTGVDINNIEWSVKEGSRRLADNWRIPIGSYILTEGFHVLNGHAAEQIEPVLSLFIGCSSRRSFAKSVTYS